MTLPSMLALTSCTGTSLVTELELRLTIQFVLVADFLDPVTLQHYQHKGLMAAEAKVSRMREEGRD